MPTSRRSSRGSRSWAGTLFRITRNTDFEIETRRRGGGPAQPDPGGGPQPAVRGGGAASRCMPRCPHRSAQLLLAEIQREQQEPPARLARDRRTSTRSPGLLDTADLLVARRPRHPRAQGPARSHPVTQARDWPLARNIFDVIREGDILLHHPYDSFATSVERFIQTGGRRSRRAGDQADALPHRRRLQHRAAAGSRRRSGASRWRC